MKKINVLVIIRDHLATLYDDTTGKISLVDFSTFYILPLVFGFSYYVFPFVLPQEINGALIAVFSVFAALLFSAQIALYGLSPKSPKTSEDKVSNDREYQRFKRDRKFFSDVNYNISYLILLSCLSLLTFVAMMVVHLPLNVEGAVLVSVVVHFFLTLLMLVKRTHIAFSSKYSEG